MDDSRVLEMMQNDYRQLNTTMMEVKEKLGKLDDINDSINKLAEQDQRLHERVSEKTDEIGELKDELHRVSERVTKVETKLSTNRIWIGSLIAGVAALGAFLILFK